MNIQSIGLVGYGEVGKIFGAGLEGPGRRRVSQRLGLEVCRRRRARRPRGRTRRPAVSRRSHRCKPCVHASELIISAVTASNTLSVAQEAAPHIRRGTLFLDLNSASPGTKQKAAALIDAAGAHYVEAGVMTSVPPYGIRVPMLLGGAGRAELAAVLGRLGHGCEGRI